MRRRRIGSTADERESRLMAKPGGLEFVARIRGVRGLINEQASKEKEPDE